MTGPHESAADVYKAGVLAASLTRDRSGTHFRYFDDYLTAGLAPVATTLPVSTAVTTHQGGAVPPFFAGLLPEGRRLTALRTKLKASADDEFTLLLAVGSDTAGDVQVVEAGQPPVAAQPLLEIPADLTGFSFTAARAGAYPFDRVGLPGVQDKVSARMINLPAARRGETLIIKLAPPEFPGVIDNVLSVARAAGLSTVKWRVLEDGEGTKALAVQRFDRVLDAGKVTRLAFEDATQVLGLWPADKYSVSLEEAADALLHLTSSRAAGALDLFKQVVFAVVTGNGDQHAKILALLATAAGEWRLSPAFDLPSTLPYGDNTLALELGGNKEPFSRRKLLAFGAFIGLPPALSERVIDQLLDRTLKPLDPEKVGALPFTGSRLRDLTRGLAYRRRQLAT